MEKHTLELTTQELNIIISALGEMPAKHSMPVIQSIEMQLHLASLKKNDGDNPKDTPKEKDSK